MKLPTPVCIALEKAINALIDLDPDSKLRLATMQGQIICLHFKGFELDIFLLVHSDAVEVMSAFDGDVDTTISGSVSSLIAMRENSSALFTGDVEITGNIETGKKFKRYMDALDIDWEEHLSQIVGDTAAYQTGLFFNKIKNLLEETSQNLHSNVGEYLTEEAEFTAPHSEVKHFEEGVDQLRTSTDRLSARIALLEKSRNH